MTGYPGTTDIRLAMERGELDGVCESWSSIKSTKPEWLRGKKVNIIVQSSSDGDPELPASRRSATGPLAGGADALRLIFSISEAGRPFGAAAIPADRLNALRRAFDATVKDPDFVAFAAKAKLDVEPSTGEQTADFLRRAVPPPRRRPAAIETARKLLEQQD